MIRLQRMLNELNIPYTTVDYMVGFNVYNSIKELSDSDLLSLISRPDCLVRDVTPNSNRMLFRKEIVFFRNLPFLRQSVDGIEIPVAWRVICREFFLSSLCRSLIQISQTRSVFTDCLFSSRVIRAITLDKPLASLFMFRDMSLPNRFDIVLIDSENDEIYDTFSATITSDPLGSELPQVELFVSDSIEGFIERFFPADQNEAEKLIERLPIELSKVPYQTITCARSDSVGLQYGLLRLYPSDYKFPADDWDVLRVLGSVGPRYDQESQFASVLSDVRHELAPDVNTLRTITTAILSRSTETTGSMKMDDKSLQVLATINKIGSLVDKLDISYVNERSDTVLELATDVSRTKASWNSLLALVNGARRSIPSMNLSNLEFGADVFREYQVLVHPLNFNSILTKLIDNAYKYSIPMNGKREPVRIGVENPTSGSGELIISVSNVGPALERADMGRIFDKRVRGTGAIQSRVQGSGLGLYHARTIASLSGMRLEHTQRPPLAKMGTPVRQVFFLLLPPTMWRFVRPKAGSIS